MQSKALTRNVALQTGLPQLEADAVAALLGAKSADPVKPLPIANGMCAATQLPPCSLRVCVHCAQCEAP